MHEHICNAGYSFFSATNAALIPTWTPKKSLFAVDLMDLKRNQNIFRTVLNWFNHLTCKYAHKHISYNAVVISKYLGLVQRPFIQLTRHKSSFLSYLSRRHKPWFGSIACGIGNWHYHGDRRLKILVLNPFVWIILVNSSLCDQFSDSSGLVKFIMHALQALYVLSS